MTKKQYAKKIAAIVNGSVTEADKANGIRLTGIVVKGESNVAPTVYIDDMYLKGVSVEDAALTVKGAIASHHVPETDLSFLCDYAKVKPLLRARLYNKATKAEVYMSAEEYGFDDLIIVPVLDLSDVVSGGSSKVTKALLAQWKVSASDVIQTALDNSSREIEIMSMSAMIAETIGCEPDFMMPETPEKVVTTKGKSFGAIGVICKAKELAEMFPDGYTVLPSSVHEVIVTPLGDEGMFGEMVRNVNAECVDAEDVLGTKAYTFAA